MRPFFIAPLCSAYKEEPEHGLFFFFEYCAESALALDDVDDLVRTRANDQVPPVDEDVLVSTPLRIDCDDVGGDRVETHSGRHHGADADTEVDVGHGLNFFLLDSGNNLSPLFGRRCSDGSRGAGRRSTGRG